MNYNNYFENIYNNVSSEIVKKIYESIKLINNDRILKISDKKVNLNIFENIGIIGWGKSAHFIIDHLIELLQDIFKISSFSITPTKPKLCDFWFKGYHPFLHIDNYYNTQELCKKLKTLPENSLLIAVSTGGGSANLWSPVESIEPKAKIDLINELICKNINCRSLNNIRKSISSVKAGKLLDYVNSKTILNIVISDDIFSNGIDIEASKYVASGPLLNQQINYNLAIKDLKKNGLFEKTNQKIKNLLILGNLNNNQKYIYRELISVTLADNRDFLKNIYNKLNNDYIVFKYDKTITEDIKNEIEIMSEYFIKIKSTSDKPFFLIGGGEAVSPKINNKGYGGRVQHFICSLALKLINQKNIIIAGFASDGNDFIEDVAGGIIQTNLIQEKKIIDILKDSINNYDSGNFLRKYGRQITSSQNKININDVIIIGVIQ